MNAWMNAWMNAMDEVERRRLWWRSRRGMLELDLLFMPFIEHRYVTLGATDQATYGRLLEEDDPTLLEWCAGREIPEDVAYARIVAMLRGEL